VAIVLHGAFLRCNRPSTLDIFVDRLRKNPRQVNHIENFWFVSTSLIAEILTSRDAESDPPSLHSERLTQVTRAVLQTPQP
jgi:hypothetical protein